MQLVLFQLHHQLCAVVDAIKESLLLICRAKATAQVEDGIVVIQRQIFQKGIQFFEAVPDTRWIVFVRFCVGAVQLMQHRFAIRITGVKRMVLGAAFQQF